MTINIDLPLVERLRVATTDAHIREAMAALAEDLGLSAWSMTAIVDTPDGPTAAWDMPQIPRGFEDYYFSAEDKPRDPVMQHARTSSIPLVWDQDIYAKHGEAQQHDVLRHFGMTSGIIAALHLPHGRHFCMGIETREELRKDPSRVRHMLPLFQLLLTHTQHAYARIAEARQAPADPEFGEPLSTRELQALRWTAMGKTAWECSVILGLSESMTTKYLDTAARKLGCVNKTHAVATAIRRRLIE